MGRRKKKQKNNLDIEVVILFIISIVLGILIYGKPGYIGQNFIPYLEQAFGWIEYLFPVAIFSAAVNIACEEDRKTIVTKILQYLTLVLAISVILTVLGRRYWSCRKNCN